MCIRDSLNTELLLPLLKTLVVPLLSDEEVVAMLVELMKKDPDFGEMAGLSVGIFLDNLGIGYNLYRRTVDEDIVILLTELIDKRFQTFAEEAAGKGSPSREQTS